MNDGPPDPIASAGWTARIGRWALPACWLLLPLVMGPSLSAALDPTASLFRTSVASGLWLAWGAGLAVTLIPRTVTLTAVRIAAPALVIAGVWAAWATPHVGARDLVSVAYAAVVAVVALAPATGESFVNGSAYGLERRLPLRAPGALMIGPVELAWLAVVAGFVAGPLLVVDRQWIAGAALVIVGWPVAIWSARSLHLLSQRWLVFTPAGLVLHDRLAAVESVLVIRRHLASIGPALVDTTARDLTLGAFGLAVEVGLTEPLPMSPAPRRRLRSHDEVTNEEISAFLFTPTRPGTVMAEARRRRLV